jgi:hypothetical protein
MVFETIPMVLGTNTMGTKPETILSAKKKKVSSSKDLGCRKYHGLCNWDHGMGENTIVPTTDTTVTVAPTSVFKVFTIVFLMSSRASPVRSSNPLASFVVREILVRFRDFA